ncbi:MAG: HAMP domain-containing histidine kinase [Candidatus Sungbacteria bacterium]|uniref:histidine kinase n=1 Tax=Candidatus Sungiibacteriota bacterium TaxID=2750080 RepID=A0A932YWS1_9BACT|nr:HAMP domain-containing histidine kinase [Candidatus Sungbacteria bacterium]
MPKFLRRLNVVTECRELHLGLWSCPPFLFVVMGAVNIAAMSVSYLFANRYVAEPQLAALIVIGVALIFFIVGVFIIHGFTQIAEANRMKSEFIAIVSHQLRSPLSVFKWILSALVKDQAPAGAGVRNTESYLEMLRDNAEKMIQLVNILLEVSRIEAGRMILRRDAVRIGVITEEIVHSFAAYARASNLTIDYVAPVDLPPVAGDTEKIRMVIQNLVDNAIRYSFGGGRVVVTIAPHDGLLEWKVRDSGVGIPKEQHAMVFQKFFRSEHAVRAETQGSGLGLYIARSVIAALGGEIGFESEEGRGSTFWFRLPLYKG